MTHAQQIVDALTSGNPEQPELPLDPSIDLSQSMVREIAHKAVKDYVDRRRYGKPVYDYSVHEHGIMYSDYFSGSSTYGTSYDEVFVGTGENAHEALEDAMNSAAEAGWDTRSIKNEFDPESEDNVQNTVRQNNPDMDEDDAADGVYYFISLFVREVPSDEDDLDESKQEPDPDMLQALGKVAIDAGRRKFVIGSLFRSSSDSADFAQRCLNELEQVDKARANSIRLDYSDELKRAERGEEVDDFAFETLPRIMQEYCPPLTQFGSHPGAGDDIGCWPEYDRLREAQEYGNDPDVIVLDWDSPEGIQARSGSARMEQDYAAFPRGDEWEVWDIKRGRALWRA